MHLDPGLFVFHDILSPQERKDVIKTAGPFVSHFFQLLSNPPIGALKSDKDEDFKVWYSN